MNKFIAFLAVIIPGLCLGVQPVSMDSHGSYYELTHETISVSSASVTTITRLAQPNDYREIYLKAPGDTTVVYYRIDGSTVNIPTTGYGFVAQDGHEIESSGVIYLQLGSGAAAVTLRKVEARR